MAKAINIIGAGSLGSYTAQIISKMGPCWNCPIYVWDFDTVEKHNTDNQIYGSNHVGQPKVLVLKEIVSALGGSDITPVNRAVTNIEDLRGIVIVAVDRMSVRSDIFSICKYNWGVEFFIEARMGGHLGKIYALTPTHGPSVRKYIPTLHDDSEAANPVCTTNETLPALWMVAAGIAQIVLLHKRDSIFESRFVEATIDLKHTPLVNSTSVVLV